MSDFRKIMEFRNPYREAATGPEARKIRALEDSADALEGIRQDLAAISSQMGQLIQAMGQKR